MGKGFAIVAGEVKDLARESADASEDITRRVDAIRTDTENAVGAIAEIGSVIARIKDFQTSIAGAVEEQTATTREMARNVSEAAVGSATIADSITGVAAAAGETSNGVSAARSAAGELAVMSDELQTLVGAFRY
jgi:methyl-accepting chemotaxis protein